MGVLTLEVLYQPCWIALLVDYSFLPGISESAEILDTVRNKLDEEVLAAAQDCHVKLDASHAYSKAEGLGMRRLGQGSVLLYSKSLPQDT